MPNWCENTLRVTGDPGSLGKFKKQAEGPNGHLDANKFIPYPEEFALLDSVAKDPLTSEETTRAVMMGLKGKDLTRDGYNQGGYDWCIQNWGTKWNFSEITIEEISSHILIYEFLTAWSPPEPLVIKMSQMFPSLKFELEYREEGVDFEGLLTAENGIYKTET